jgi:hypothetical protein
MINIMIHVMNDDPILGEVESLPGLTDQLIKVSHPRKKDGKDLPYLQANVTEVIWPITRITFIELMPSEDEDEIFGFVRE